MNDLITQGGGEELMDMTPDELRAAINKYLDKGVDFVKYGGTSHANNPVFIGFSPDAQRTGKQISEVPRQHFVLHPRVGSRSVIVPTLNRGQRRRPICLLR